MSESKSAAPVKENRDSELYAILQNVRFTLAPAPRWRGTRGAGAALTDQLDEQFDTSWVQLVWTQAMHPASGTPPAQAWSQFMGPAQMEQAQVVTAVYCTWLSGHILGFAMGSISHSLHVMQGTHATLGTSHV